MKFLILFAFKNIIRQKRRTLLTSFVISIAIIFFIIMSSLLKGTYDVSFENELKYNTSHMKIRNENYDENTPFELNNFMKNYNDVIEKLKIYNFIEGFTEIISFTCELDNMIDSRFVVIMGINSNTIESVFEFKKFINGDMAKDDKIIIGEQIAKDMNIEIGNSIFLTYKKKDLIESTEFIVSGIISSPNPVINNQYVYIEIEKAKEMIGQDAITEIAIKTNDYKKCNEYKDKLKDELKDVKIYTWEELAENFLKMAQAKAKGNGAVIFFIAIIGFVGVINTTMISVYEKRREIGTLKTLGMREKEILTIFIIECFLIGLIGVLIGVVIGSLANIYFVVKGINMISGMGFENMNIGYKVLGVIKSRWDIPSIIFVSILTLILSTFAGYFPARKGVRMEISDALRVIQ